MKDKMEKCKDCKYLDRERSNDKWTVCSSMPIDVQVSGTSKDCTKYKKEK